MPFALKKIIIINPVMSLMIQIEREIHEAELKMEQDMPRLSLSLHTYCSTEENSIPPQSGVADAGDSYLTNKSFSCTEHKVFRVSICDLGLCPSSCVNIFT